MIHRDVKPGNILITPDGHAKLTDLGLAFFAEEHEEMSQSKPKHIVGTADFLAPEIIVTPSEVKSISDIYSLGCTLYYAVTGKVPFPGGDTADKLRRQLEEMPISPMRLNPEVDEEFANVIAAMMQKRPDDRIATATEVVARLQPWASPVESTSWQEIKEVVQRLRRDRHANASLAETIPASHEPEDTDRREPAKLLNDSQGVPALANSTADAASPSQGLSRSTTALVAVAVTIAMLAISLVLSSL